MSFICNRCGNCCRWRGIVRLREGEAAAIAAHLGMSELDFINRYTDITPDRRGLTLIENSLGHCIFFADAPPTCLIDVVKPQQCRDFPEKWNFPGWQNECSGTLS